MQQEHRIRDMARPSKMMAMRAQFSGKVFPGVSGGLIASTASVVRLLDLLRRSVQKDVA